jgi:8-oxo-dGTP diphosphatase
MPYTPILAALGYVLSRDRRKVLMVHPSAREHDHHIGKHNGLGGKLEADEDGAAGLCSEIREEAGIECLQMSLRGTISWPGFGRDGEDWFGFLFLITCFRGKPLEHNSEGTLEWVDVDNMGELCLWEDDRHFLPLGSNEDPRPLHGVMPYRDGRTLSWKFNLI